EFRRVLFRSARDNLLHAAEFTKIENTAIAYVLRGWFGSLFQPEKATEIDQLSDDVWATTTLFEHFASELNSDPSTRTKISVAIYDELESRAAASQDKLNKILGTDEDERMNVLTDKIADEVLKK